MITDLIKKWMEKFPTMTKEESDYIYEVLHWNGEVKAAFLLAKNIFEEEQEQE